VHSNIQLVNSSGLTLQLGYLSPMGLSAQPLPLATLAPGDAVWLPVQVTFASCRISLHCSVAFGFLILHCSIVKVKGCSFAAATQSALWGVGNSPEVPCLISTTH
jgi:hypothetical protein